MSELVVVCHTLESVNSDIRQTARNLQTAAQRISRAAVAAAAIRDEEGRPDSSARQLATSLEAAVRQLQATVTLLMMAVQAGSAFVQRTVGNVPGGSGAVGALGGVALAGVVSDAESEPTNGTGGASEVVPDPPYSGALGPYEVLPDDMALSEADIRNTRTSQGSLGDCGCIALLDAIIAHDPAMASGIVTDQGNGTYTVALHEGGEIQNIRLQGTAPRGAAAAKSLTGGTRRPGFPTLVEKALAHKLGGYVNLNEVPIPYVYEKVLGCEADHFPTRQGVADDIVAAMSRGPVLAQTPPCDMQLGLIDTTVKAWAVPKHAYAVISVEGSGPHARIHVRNPWGEAGREENATHERAADLFLSEADFISLFDWVHCVKEGQQAWA